MSTLAEVNKDTAINYTKIKDGSILTKSNVSKMSKTDDLIITNDGVIYFSDINLDRHVIDRFRGISGKQYAILNVFPMNQIAINMINNYLTLGFNYLNDVYVQAGTDNLNELDLTVFDGIKIEEIMDKIKKYVKNA